MNLLVHIKMANDPFGMKEPSMGKPRLLYLHPLVSTRQTPYRHTIFQTPLLRPLPLPPRAQHARPQPQIRRNIFIEFRKLAEEICPHRPRIDIPNPCLKHWRKLIFARFAVPEVCVPEVVRPEDFEVVLEEVPEKVCAVAMLGEDEAFADGGPK